uniref:RNase H type-1 domain-containing protein n=1 Tax=Cannabis sativa TaxID=3483 RepID=A0A803Q9W9_CANSA
MVCRAGTNCLPTMCQLLTKRVVVNAVCPICNVEEETIFHCVVTCQEIKCCRDRVGIGTHLLHGDNFWVWLKDIFERLEPGKRGLIATLCWAIWNARNETVWKKKKVSALDIAASAKNYLNQWRDAQNFQIETPCPELQKAIFEVEARTGMGVVARDDKGMFLEGFTKIYNEKLDPTLVDALSMREALSWLNNKNWQHAFLETDCHTMMFTERVEKCLVMFCKTARQYGSSFARASICYPGRMFSLGNVPTVVLPHLVADFEG